MFSFSSSRLPYSYPLKASIHLCLTFCFKVSAAPSFKSPALSVLTTFPCVLHNFLCLSQLTKLFSASYICGVFTSFLDIPNFPSKSRNAAVLSLTYTSSLCRIYSPQDFPVFTTHLLNFWCFCHTTGTASATFGGSQTLLSLWIDGFLVFFKPTIFYSVEFTPSCPDLPKN